MKNLDFTRALTFLQSYLILLFFAKLWFPIVFIAIITSLLEALLIESLPLRLEPALHKLREPILLNEAMNRKDIFLSLEVLCVATSKGESGITLFLDIFPLSGELDSNSLILYSSCN